jgi:hypothetical protein
MAIRWIGAAAHAAKRLRTNKSGVSAAELAMVMPVFALMIAGVTQYGVLFYTYNVALNGARNAARALAVGSADPAQAEAIMLESLPLWVAGSRAAIRNAAASRDRVQIMATDADVGAEVRARIVIPSVRATVLPLAPMPDSLTVSVVMVKEG